MDFIRLWSTGILNPIRFSECLRGKPAPLWGLVAVAIRFAGTALTTGILAIVLRLRPFQPSFLAFLPTAVRLDRVALDERRGTHSASPFRHAAISIRS